VARQSPDRRNAEDPADEDLGDLDILDDSDDADDDPEEAESAPVRDSATEAFWAEVRVDPIEIALPTGSGWTLRAYRPAAELTPTEVEEPEEDPFAPSARRLPEQDDDTVVVGDLPVEVERGGRRRARRDDEADDEGEDADIDADDEADEFDEEDFADDIEDEADDEDDSDAPEEAEDVPVFLGHRGKLFLFRTPESLVEFVKSGAEHDLAQLDSWSEVVGRIRPEDMVPEDDDSYELDLVVDNLRAGHDAWDAELVISAGEVARDIAYAYRMEPILTALSPGTPLDDLDEALRSTVEGGLGGFFAKRRLRKIGTQQATLGWRTIIGKISGVVVWRD